MPRARGLAGPCLAVSLAAACGGSTSATTGAQNGGDGGADSTAGDGPAEGGGSSSGSSSGGPDDGPTGPTGCVPHGVPGYSPAWHPPNAPQVACVDTELDDFLVACIGVASTQADCNTYQAAHAQCFGCMVTPDTSGTWGPIVASTLTPFTYGNFAGCLSIETGDQSSTSCGALQQATRVCTELACNGPQCPAITQPEVAQIAQCVADASDLVCGQYHSKELDCVQGMVTAGGPGAAAVHYCSQATYGDEVAFYRALGLVFCASSPATDGGTDAAPPPNDGGDGGD
jgi:hypothetical protein